MPCCPPRFELAARSEPRSSRTSRVPSPPSGLAALLCSGFPGSTSCRASPTLHPLPAATRGHRPHRRFAGGSPKPHKRASKTRFSGAGGTGSPGARDQHQQRGGAGRGARGGVRRRGSAAGAGAAPGGTGSCPRRCGGSGCGRAPREARAPRARLGAAVTHSESESEAAATCFRRSRGRSRAAEKRRRRRVK